MFSQKRKERSLGLASRLGPAFQLSAVTGFRQRCPRRICIQSVRPRYPARDLIVKLLRQFQNRVERVAKRREIRPIQDALHPASSARPHAPDFSLGWSLMVVIIEGAGAPILPPNSDAAASSNAIELTLALEPHGARSGNVGALN
jgi:hypothetical protein